MTKLHQFLKIKTKLRLKTLETNLTFLDQKRDQKSNSTKILAPSRY